MPTSLLVNGLEGGTQECRVIIVEWGLYVIKLLNWKTALHSSLFEKYMTKVLEGSLFVSSLDEERDVIITSSIRNHANRDILHRVSCQCFETKIAPVEVADYTYDTHVCIDGYGAILLQFVYNLCQMGRIIDTHRNADLTGCNHVYRCLITLENFKDLS